jgi:hypothetical protein
MIQHIEHHIAKDLDNIIHVGAVLIDEAGIVDYPGKIGALFASLRDDEL